MNSKTKISKLSRRIGVRRFSAVELLISLVMFVVMTPFLDDSVTAPYLEPLVLTLVLVAGLLAVGGRRHVLWAGTVLLLPAIVSRWLHHLYPEFVSPAFFLASGLVFVAFVGAHILRFILRAPRVDREVICAGISVYLIIGLLWSLAYRMLGMMVPDAFVFAGVPLAEQEMTSFNAFYFSFSTLSSVGYGDITPASKLARMLAVMEAVTGILYVAVLISRLVSLYSPLVPESDKES
jgi:voltage-gated potassium channel